MPILLEIQYLAPIQYYSKLCSGQAVYIEQHEHYIKHSYRNRCHIAGSHGLLRLSIPLQKGKHEGQSIRDVRIAYSQKWQHQHWEAIRSGYGRAPFFEHYADELLPFFEKKYDFLFDFNFELTNCLLELLGLDADIQLTDTYEKQAPADILDFRSGIHPKPHRQKNDPDFTPVPYAQVFAEKHGFLPNLSIIDLLFCTGPGAVLILEG